MTSTAELREEIEALDPKLKTEFKNGFLHACYRNERQALVLRATLKNRAISLFRNGKPLPTNYNSSYGVKKIREVAALMLSHVERQKEMTEKKLDPIAEIDTVIEALLCAELTLEQAVEFHSVLEKERDELKADGIHSNCVQKVLYKIEEVIEDHAAATKNAIERAREEFECAQEEAAESAIED